MEIHLRAVDDDAVVRSLENMLGLSHPQANHIEWRKRANISFLCHIKLNSVHWLARYTRNIHEQDGTI